MKKLIYIISTAALTCLLSTSSAQSINWKSLQPQERHIVNLNAGFDNATVIGVGYGYKMNTRVLNTTMPLVLNLEYSMPFGNKVFDDLKTKIGGQLNIVDANSFYATVKVYGIIRRYQNDFARMVNFGSEMTATAGIYKNNWYAAAEFGFDKAITTHIKHSSLMKQYNPGVQTGWYIPTAGNFIYGIQGGYSLKRNDVFAKVGRSLAQDFKTKPIIPYYFQLGWNVRL